MGCRVRCHLFRKYNNNTVKPLRTADNTVILGMNTFTQFYLLVLSLQLKVDLVELMLNLVDAVVRLFSCVVEALLRETNANLVLTQIIFLQTQ